MDNLELSDTLRQMAEDFEANGISKEQVVRQLYELSELTKEVIVKIKFVGA